MDGRRDERERDVRVPTKRKLYLALGLGLGAAGRRPPGGSSWASASIRLRRAGAEMHSCDLCLNTEFCLCHCECDDLLLNLK